MWRYGLNLIYAGLILVALPVLLYRRWTQGKYRDGWQEKLLGQVPRRVGAAECLWLHAVSVGEVLQIQPIVAGWRARHPGWDIVITTTTQTGREVAIKQYPDCQVCYCPVDFTWSVAEAFSRIRPTCLGLVELELWPNLLAEARRRGVITVLMNGRLSAKSFGGYRKIQPLLSRLWPGFASILVQNEDYAARFRALGVVESQLVIAGSIKFDRLQTDRQTPRITAMRQALGLTAGAPVLMGGSTHAPEEETLLRVWKKLRVRRPDLQLILAPRHAERFDQMAELIEREQLVVRRRSECSTSATSSGNDLSEKSAVDGPPAVCLLDTLGELSDAWGLADFAFVGGSLNQRGGQNMMEPAAYGAAVLLGPNTWNFAEVVSSLKAESACFEVRDEHKLEQKLAELLSDPVLAREAGQRAQALVMSQQGGTRITLDRLDRILYGTVCESVGEPVAAAPTSRRAA